LSRRHDRPNAILWLLRHHEELRDSQIMRLVGTTKPTIESIRNRTHWNSSNLQPQDPVALGLCSQTDLDAEVARAARRLEAERRKVEKEMREQGIEIEPEPMGTLLPAEETSETSHQSSLLVRKDQPVETGTVGANEQEDRNLTIEDVFGPQDGKQDEENKEEAEEEKG
jgi:hypothetical protein